MAWVRLVCPKKGCGRRTYRLSAQARRPKGEGWTSIPVHVPFALCATPYVRQDGRVGFKIRHGVVKAVEES